MSEFVPAVKFISIRPEPDGSRTLVVEEDGFLWLVHHNQHGEDWYIIPTVPNAGFYSKD